MRAEDRLGRAARARQKATEDFMETAHAFCKKLRRDVADADLEDAWHRALAEMFQRGYLSQDDVNDLLPVPRLVLMFPRT